MLFINTSDTTTPSWARNGKSTVFDLVLNAQTEENDFIEDEMPTTEVMSYSPELAQELQSNKGDPAFDYLYAMFKALPTGEAVKKNILLVFAGGTETPVGGNDDDDEEGGTVITFDAWNCTATLTLDHFDTVAEKLYYSLSISKVTRGTATITAGVPSFVAD